MFDGETAKTFAYREARGAPPARTPYVHQRHDCDPRCVRPDHLHVSAGRRPKVPAAVRFWTFVLKRAPNECWLWTGNVVRARDTGIEYGLFGIAEDDTVLAHRYAWTLTNGAIPVGKIVRHVVCRNTLCVNPTHLAVGTHKDNHDDAVRDGMVAYVTVKNAVRGFPVHMRRAKTRGR